MTIHWCNPNEAVGDIADPPRRPAPCPVTCGTCPATSEAPVHTGWQWCDLREEWYCPTCGIPALTESQLSHYVSGLWAGYGDALGFDAPPVVDPVDPWFLRGVKRGRASAAKDRP